jgi:hypothetical protein
MRTGQSVAKVYASGSNDPPLFLVIDRALQRAVIQRSPALHLDKHDFPSRLTYYIDLPPPSSEVAVENLVTF